jgi:hypothetical protein
MAFITREYYKLLDKNKLIEHGDWIQLERMSRQAGMKNGNGVSSQTFRNAVVKGFTTTDEVVSLIEVYFAPKFDTVKAKRLAIKEIKKKLQSA